MSDFAFELKPAIRKAIPPLVGLWGKSGSGKTYSALLLARGLVGPKGKIAVIDTENHRAGFYADMVGGWEHLDLQPPFSPDKFSAAFKFCEDQKADVIVVDSISHVWSGQGGVLDMAETGTSKTGKKLTGVIAWKVPKMAYKRMLNNLIRSPIPVIFCIRAKDGVKQVGQEVVQTGPQPIADKDMIYEMTVDLHLVKDGQYDLETSKMLPATLRDIIKSGGVVNEVMGKAIAEYCGAGVAPDETLEKLKRDGANAATEGVEAYTAWLKTIPDANKPKIKQYHKEWSATAKAADAEPEGEYAI